MSVIRQAEAWASRASDCSIFERVLEALPDGVLLINSARKVVYANPSFARMWKIPNAVLTSADDGAILQYAASQLIDPEGFRQEVERLHSTTDLSEDEIVFKDGRTISRKSLPVREFGNLSTRIWIFTDVTEAKNASIDPLTRLPNRLTFSREFPPFVTTPPDGLTRSVAILDVDHFKQYNDLYGHSLGDEVLIKISAILQMHVGKSGDHAFRIGGEEFLIAMRTRSVTEAKVFCELVREGISAMNIEHSGNEPHRFVTVSMGLISFDSAPDPRTVFENADKALYEAKAGGRNRIAVATNDQLLTASHTAAHEASTRDAN